jgi:outer membrane autotransporter protein
MRYFIRFLIPAIFAVAGLLVSVSNATAAFFNELNEYNKYNELSVAGMKIDPVESSFLDRPFFSTDVEFYLGQKQRRRGEGGRFWTNLYYADTSLKPKDTGYKIKPELYGLQLGFEFVQTHGVYLTLFGNFNQSDTKFGSRARAKTDNYLFGIGKYVYLSGCHFGGTASIGYDQYKVQDQLFDVHSKGSGMQLNLFGEFGIDFIFGKWGLKPFYALQYDFLYHGRIGEPETVFQGDWNGHGLIQLMGLRINWKLFEMMEIQARAAWVHELLDKPPQFYHARFSAVQGTATPAVFFYDGNIGRDWAWLGFGLKFEAIYNAFLFLDYDLTMNERHTTHLANLGICFGW